MTDIKQAKFFKILFWVVMANFIAQIPYYIKQYYIVHRILPSLIGVFLMSIVLAWFLIGYHGLVKNKRLGNFVTLVFLIVEFLFYLQTQIVQLLSGKGIFLHVLHPDGLVLFLVFFIGYINFLFAPWFILCLVKMHHEDKPRQPEKSCKVHRLRAVSK